jgi:hypothetical protein
MPGAIVPTDWDGVTYTERKVMWPNSSQWLSILGGGLSRSALLEFWDDADGGAEDAAAIGSSLISLNVDGIYFPGLCQSGASMNFEAFRSGSANSVSPNVWTPISYFTDVVNRDGANWLNDRHEVREGQYGLWMYTVAVGGLDNLVPSQYLGFWTGYPSLFAALTAIEFPSTTRMAHTAILYFDADVDVVPAAFSSGGYNFGVNKVFTYLKGVRLAGLS